MVTQQSIKGLRVNLDLNFKFLIKIVTIRSSVGFHFFIVLRQINISKISKFIQIVFLFDYQNCISLNLDREETLTEVILHWNKRKALHLAEALAKRIKRVCFSLKIQLFVITRNIIIYNYYITSFAYNLSLYSGSK